MAARRPAIEGLIRNSRKGEFQVGGSNPQSGFSLIEVLIALAIIAAMTGALVETVVADAHARFAVQQRRDALLIAQSALDRARGGESADSGGASPGAAALFWHIDRQPYAEGSVPFAATRLEQLTVTVEDAGHRQFARLTTVRIAQ
jgi:prepilin-type N-terminal cleavage/methylation domain-containing protein